MQVLSFKILQNTKMTSVAHKLSPQSTSSSMIDFLYPKFKNFVIFYYFNYDALPIQVQQTNMSIIKAKHYFPISIPQSLFLILLLISTFWGEWMAELKCYDSIFISLF